MVQLENIATEKQNAATLHIDTMSTLTLLRTMHAEDKKAAAAVEPSLPIIVQAVDIIADKLRHGGRLIYIGAGTSGRLGILDAVECPPTFGTDPSMVQGIIAGGYNAIFRAVEGAEDSAELAVRDLQERQLTERDVLVGIAASGRTPYTLSAIKYAREIGSVAISLTCSPDSPMEKAAQLAIVVVPGPEVITGSTRLKSGTVQKLVLNMLSTGTMIKLGKVYGNLMVDVKASNQKLTERALRIVMTAAGVDRREAEKTLREANGQAKLAIFMLLSGEPLDSAQRMLAEADGFIRVALDRLKEF